MTFEAMDTRAPAAAADNTSAPSGRSTRRAAKPEHPADAMMTFVMKSEHVACELRALALLFRGVFCDDEVRVTDDASTAADLIDDMLKSIAGRLDANAEHARAARDHLVGGAAR